MRCPSCHAATKVLESRSAAEDTAIRRRRECSGCGRRFTTYERYERGPLFVFKRDGRREPFDRDKCLEGILRNIHKRPVDPAKAEELVDSIAQAIEEAGGSLGAETVGELVLRGLRELDAVSYVRYASVYREFDDLAQFQSELERLDRGDSTANSDPSTDAGSVRPDLEDAELRQ